MQHSRHIAKPLVHLEPISDSESQAEAISWLFGLALQWALATGLELHEGRSQHE